MAFAPPPPPTSALGFYRLLSPTASVRVSPLCLGGMNFGESWREEVGPSDHQAILDLFYDHGGNFIDTANNYHKGESERLIGQWMMKRGVRDQMVIATKYCTPYRTGYGDREIIVNTGGNGTKSLRLSLDESLKNLQTTYIDLLYVHWWDFTCSIEELMHALNDVVTSGKVCYVGASDMPAWIVAKANQYARDHGLRQFSVYQGNWSAACRDFERDIIPMALAEGMAIAPWGAIGGGTFKTEAERKAVVKGMSRKIAEPDANTTAVVAALEIIAKRKETEITSIALAYVMQKAPYVFPIVGCRRVEQLKANIKALRIELSTTEIEEIEKAGTFELGFPHSMIGTGPANWLNAIGGTCDWVAPQKPIAPHQM